MSRSGYTDDYDDDGSLNLYRGAVERAIRGKRGQKFLRDLVSALDALPVKALIDGELEYEGQVCALGSVGKMRGLAMDGLSEDGFYDPDKLAKTFGIAPSMAREIMYENDEGAWRTETPEERWKRVREWAMEHIIPTPH